jgi:hypothetical protein
VVQIVGDHPQALSSPARGALSQPPEPLRLPAPLNRLPWDIAQDEFGVKGADFIGVWRRPTQIDEGSFSFRYMTTKAGKPSIDKDKLPHINIGILAEGMEKLTSYLFGLGEAFPRGGTDPV